VLSTVSICYKKRSGGKPAFLTEIS
jgi:hypothetical protein